MNLKIKYLNACLWALEATHSNRESCCFHDCKSNKVELAARRLVSNRVLKLVWSQEDTSDITGLLLTPRASRCLTSRKSCWVGCSYQDRARCETVLLKSTGCSPKNSPSPGLEVSLSLTLSSSLSVCLSHFPSTAWFIDPLNAFRTSYFTSCKCFSSSERPLGVQMENLADGIF